MKVMILFGTRPEIIKLAPVIRAFEKYKGDVEVLMVSTGQHRDFTRQMNAFFELNPHYNLDIMRDRQTLAHITAAVISKLDPILEKEQPDVLVIQGDTTSSAAAAVAACFRRIPVAHVEAGLRTHEKLLPFPEEVNRCITAVAADWHFAPTELARENLLREGKDPDRIYVTGNTVVDALHMIMNGDGDFPDDRSTGGIKELLVTVHRRESFGPPIERICYALRAIVERHEDVSMVIPVHPNPNVREPVVSILGRVERINLTEPVSYFEFLKLLKRCYMVLSDSGGVQEEAPTLGKPILVLREVTERPEAIQAGAARLVGTDPDRIVDAAEELLLDADAYRSMTGKRTLFGDGMAAERIAAILMREIAGKRVPVWTTRVWEELQLQPQ